MDVPEGADTAAVGIGQWVPGIDFGGFTERTMSKTYASENGSKAVPAAASANGAAKAQSQLLREGQGTEHVGGGAAAAQSKLLQSGVKVL